MRNVTTTLLCFLLLLGFQACQEDSDLDLAEPQNALLLPDDAPTFVKELAHHLETSMSEGAIESRSDELSIYEYVGFKPNLSIFKAAVDRTPGLKLLLENPFLSITAFVPNNDAFVQFLADNGLSSLDDVPQILLNQVLANHIILSRKDVDWLESYMRTLANADCNVGGKLNIFTEVLNPREAIINGSVNIVEGNLFVGRSFVHVVDKVIAPSKVDDFITADPQFSILAEALNWLDMGIEDIVAENGFETFTLFAPTNDAFQPLLDELGLGSVCDINISVLTEILALHVKPGASVPSVQLIRGTTLPTLAGIDITTERMDKDIIVNGPTNSAKVVIRELQANNGIIHAIDDVLLP